MVLHESEARSEKVVSICPAGLGQMPREVTHPGRSLTALEPCWRGSQMEPVLPAIPVSVRQANADAFLGIAGPVF